MRERKSMIDTHGGPTAMMGAGTNQRQSPGFNIEIMRMVVGVVLEKWLSEVQVR